jgi:glycosyltransferase involved in cell wall biosynthesis
MASGRPVIAYGRGGVLDTVVPGVTGTFFEAQTADALADALNGFDASRFDPQTIRRHAEQFDSTVFRRRMQDLIDTTLAERTRCEPLDRPAAAAAVRLAEPALPMVMAE